MLLFLLSHIASTSGSPIALPQSDVADVVSDPPSKRTVYNIIWSCLTTIFACTWIAIHPNVPSPYDSRKQVILRRAMIMGVAVLFPEYIAVWALRQWTSAMRITSEMQAKHNCPAPWTITHSFFLIMGGFMLCDSQGVALEILSFDEMIKLEGRGQITFPSLTENEILDKSKGDAVSKTILLLQTSWFLIQVIARTSRKLPVTELELVTIAYASINLFAYGLWWRKPLNVECPVRICLPVSGPTRSGAIAPGAASNESDENTRVDTECDPPGIHGALPVESPKQVETSLCLSEEAAPIDENAASLSATELDASAEQVDCNALATGKSHPSRVKRAAWLEGFWRKLTNSLPTPRAVVLFLLKDLPMDILPQVTRPGPSSGFKSPALTSTSDDVSDTISFCHGTESAPTADRTWQGLLRVPTFACGGQSRPIFGVVQLCMSLYLGAIHCVAWDFEFPLYQTRWVWNVPSGKRPDGIRRFPPNSVNF